MTDRYSDFEELRPTGEASDVPDETLSECEGDPDRQRVATATTGYPDTPAETDTECRSCGAPIPADQTRCLFCLTNHLENSSSETDAPAPEWTLLGVVHMLVESSTFYGAVAKGGAAATLLASSVAESTVNDCTIIYDLEDEPAAQLTDQWPVLPAAVRISSADGEQLFAAAHDRTGWTDQSAVDGNYEPTTYLYDEGGTGIRDEQRLATLLANAGDDAWLVPAIALQQAPQEREPENQDSTIPTKERLECLQCGRTTDHRFGDHESVPDETWTGHAIWECQVCGAPRYGPNPE
ncbi:biosurfactant protein 1 [Natronorubrum sulfidifaciens]|uniref:Uncharacterized protein n=1 Tax=Natronorubrum sulfidifaciens JCM 14089 TaxID=1230460 RepID=L9VXA3_9EURY|nr:hypothetical protein [Natronorubrum sulfidifaciens]ELY41631.1 hypothetical protein C495_16520 [Natronorubrum sulfidifaciens JCM 14089]